MKKLLFAGAICLLTATSALSRTSELGRHADWILLKHALDNGKGSCQAIQCFVDCYKPTSGSLVLFGGPGTDFPYLMFNHGTEPPLGSKALISVGGKSFQLSNTDNESKKFFYPANGNDAVNMLRLMRAAAASGGSKTIQVIDVNGTKRQFSATKTDKVLERIEKVCGVKLP